MANVTDANRILELQIQRYEGVNSNSPIDFLLRESTERYFDRQYQDGLTLANAALVLEPDNEIAWVNQGVGLHSLGEEIDALESFNRAIEIEPSDIASMSFCIKSDNVYNVQNR